MLDCRDIERETQKYWKSPDFDHYVRQLLGKELACAQQTPADDDLPRLQGLGRKVHTLALTVGDSLEPLLQIVCVLKPKRVVLILNNEYSDEPGEARGETLKGLISQLSGVENLPDDLRPSIPRGNISCEVLRTDAPTQVFRALLNAFGQPDMQAPAEETNAVDITGAKKSLVVGAFLYAAHSRLPITYVDFDRNKYDTTWRRPYGYACKIRPIPNPYEAFGLRDWERVRQMYHRYDFRGARELLGTVVNGNDPGSGILATMAGHLEPSSGPSLYDEEDIGKVRNLARVLEMYEAWDSGNFGEARQMRTILPETASPDAVRQLGADWFEVTATGIQSGPGDFYADKAVLKIYACDELHRITRLIQYSRDYRSAFLRSGGLNETIMVARLVDLTHGVDHERISEALRDGHTPGARNLFGFLLASSVTKPLSQFVPTGPLIGAERVDLSDWAKSSSVTSPGMRKWWKNPSYSEQGTAFSEDKGWGRFLDLRNVLAHRYVSVSRDLAQDGLRFVQANIEDFFGGSIQSMGIQAEAVVWRDLCDMCQLDFLPPRLRDNPIRR